MSNLKENNFRFEGYDEYLYTGIQGFMMRQNHRILSQNISNSLNRKILDIGGGAKPHTSIIYLKGVSEYWVSDSYKVFKKNKYLENKRIKQHIYEDDPNYEFFHKNKITFSRIIASHVWEHVHNPEDELLKWVSLLDEDGQLDIAIPCDPGWAWRLGQLIGRRKAIQTYKMSSDAIIKLASISLHLSLSDGSRASPLTFSIPFTETDINSCLFDSALLKTPIESRCLFE